MQNDSKHDESLSKEFWTTLQEKGFAPEKVVRNKKKAIFVQGTWMTPRDFVLGVVEVLGDASLRFPFLLGALSKGTLAGKFVDEWIVPHLPIEEPSDDSQGTQIAPPSDLILNVDQSATSPTGRFFCTTKEELLEPGYSGDSYMLYMGLTPTEAMRVARFVVPRFMPRHPRGVHHLPSPYTREPLPYFNTHIPALWREYQEKNKAAWDALPTELPPEIRTLIQHVVPQKLEQEYLIAWLYESLVRRSYVYLVLCGFPGIGKNRLKLLFRALHGQYNTADGKKETFGENNSRFNSQLVESTLIWFDELTYGPKMEPRMKEYQNDFVSIERKGIDATKSTEIFSSMVISNNYPRDNYILFNSRKFAPLQLGKEPLTKAMTPGEIQSLTERLETGHSSFDITLTAQTAKYILSVGAHLSKKFPNLEYRGPAFWELAHTSMSRWKKEYIQALLGHTSGSALSSVRVGTSGASQGKKVSWEDLEKAVKRAMKDRSLEYRDPSTAREFLESYRDMSGRKVFQTSPDPDSLVGNFFISAYDGSQEIDDLL